jgi:hypothetical protein
MDIKSLTRNHIAFIPHPEAANYYAIDPLPDNDAEYHFYTYMPMHNCGKVFLPEFAILVDRNISDTDFIDFLQSTVATGQIKIGDNPGGYLYRDFYEFKTFEEHEQWIEKYLEHKETQRRFWLLQHGEEKKPKVVQKSMFD